MVAWPVRFDPRSKAQNEDGFTDHVGLFSIIRKETEP
jgi:hypothetical protein